ncbi:hypothetical protein F4677DRAFT_424243 [Hypoxylon crocopeplum]|nr:hypothetical protein F4677DRAFT_424243 [Hypoxylon crocopeplum]
MKRKATEEPEGADAPEATRSRIEAAESIHGDDDYDPSIDDTVSNQESRYAATSSTFAANNTQLTPLSPARKFPSDLKTIRCTFPGCEKTFNRPARLAAHFRSHTNERPYKCTFPGCDKDYIEEKHLRQHIKGSHTNEREHVCPQPNCGKSFMTATRLRRHQAVHEGQERFRCRDFPPCDQSFRKHQTLQRHIRSEHLHTPAFPCDYQDGVTGIACDAEFDNAGALKRHQEREHGEIRYWCDECSAQQGGDDDPSEQKRVGFTTMALLQAHMKQNHASCMFCGLPCETKADLDQHIDSEHTNIKSVEERKNVACTWPGCTKKFTKRSNLNVHIRSAHQGVRFVCGEVDLSGTAGLATWPQSEGCGESFVTKANLENHVRYVHLEYERPEQPQAASKPREHSPSNILDALTGAGDKSRRTLPCTIPHCKAKFAHNGELEAHLQSEHIIEQALLEQGAPAEDVMLPMMPFDEMMPGMPEWGGNNENDAFWAGATGGIGNPEMPGPDDEWHRDEAEMQRPLHPLELAGLIDPALSRMR